MDRIALVLGAVVAVFWLILFFWPSLVLFGITGVVAVAATVIGFRTRDSSGGKFGFVVGLVTLLAVVSFVIGVGNMPPPVTEA